MASNPGLLSRKSFASCKHKLSIASVFAACLRFFFLWFAHAAASTSAIDKSSPHHGFAELPRSVLLEIDRIKKEAYSHREATPEAIATWRKILDLDPANLEARVVGGWSMILSQHGDHDHGITLLEEAFDPTKVREVIDRRMPQTLFVAATIGRYRSQRGEYAKARKFTEMALELSKGHPMVPRGSSTPDGDVCLQMQLATMFDYFPESMDAADIAIERMNAHADRLLAHEGWAVNEKFLTSSFPGAASDPAVHCLLPLFSLSFYYRADVAEVASKNYELARRGWPALSTTAEHVKKYDAEEEHGCINRKIRLAVVAGVMKEGHSNSESFGGMLSRLDRDIFDVTYVFLPEQGDTRIASFTRTHAQDKVRIFSKLETEMANGAWTTRIGKEIASWEMDIIFYFELTMSSWVRRLGMQRLAPVQANSIGHPITSGIHRSVMQYYISWGAAELPIEESQKHYTEELKLLPSDIVYQYYEPRILPGSRSRADGMSFGHISLRDFHVPTDKNVYLCMQKPFKFHPEVDELLCGIMQKDPDSWLILHRESANQEVFVNRLVNKGCDLSRITFLEAQPHHRLLALYRDSTVILDSYPAGGDTTTREVLEMGKALVTLPARLLGGRWTEGYMTTIGLEKQTMERLVASTPEQYVDLAVKLGTDKIMRDEVEADIRSKVRNLFHREEAVAAWQEMFLEISPYQLCGNCGNFTIDSCTASSA
eukprot:CCRYP_012167-RA/>CCRYP_012167-RA protein AED:0.04 eAED:0.04 QI:92/1/1/1/1/1/2/146/712